MSTEDTVLPPATVNVPLHYPITVDGQTIDSLTIRRPRVSDTLSARKAHTDEYLRGIFMLARLCDVAPEHIEKLDEGDDAVRLNAVYEGFRIPT